VADPTGMLMNGYGLTAALVQSVVSLAWPAALIVSVWMFRERLAALLPLLRVKHKDWEASFRLDQAEKEAASLPPTPEDAKKPPPPTPEEQDRFEQLAKISPRAAVMELRWKLEEATLALAKAHNLQIRQPMGLLSLTRTLRSSEVIDQHTSALLDDLRNIGNHAAHATGDFQLSADDAIRYRVLADELIERLELAQPVPWETTP
jgi:hypothetical protein